MNRSRVIAVAPGLLILALGGVWCLEHERRNRDREAREQATLRILAAFHLDYLRSHNLDLDDYQIRMQTLVNQNPKSQVPFYEDAFRAQAADRNTTGTTKGAGPRR